MHDCIGERMCPVYLEFSDITKPGETFNPDPDTVFYTQYGCQSERKRYLYEKNDIGVFITILGLTICIVFRLMITRMESELRIDDKILDYELISIDDYTVTGKINQRFFDDVVEAT